MSKHAYMIIAHNQFELLKILIKMLDDARNDIFIHIDAKVNDFDFTEFQNLTHHSKLVFTDRISITWGDFSQVKAEMILLKSAIENESAQAPYSYFHLLSGVDLPIKTNDEIHNFFSVNNGKEFIHFSKNELSPEFENRIKYYHFFRKKRNLFFKILAQIILKFQKLIGINRLKDNALIVQKGANWFSITNAFAKYVISKCDEIDKIFNYSYCCDEVFLQTIFVNSPFKDNLFMPNCDNNHFACARLIDWKRGNPYVWQKDDYDLIKSSPCMFARKFDMSVDTEIIDMLTK
ncbi:MAG: glycosyl transferase [Eubacterium sp.]|nr:glycosyl transferase [Eubacterium sp.]